MLQSLGEVAREVRTPDDLNNLAGLIIPGGESTTISRLMDRWELRKPILRMAASGAAVWGTCAGLILVSKKDLDGSVPTLGLLDVDVQRNAYGSQLDSFETKVPMPAFGKKPLQAVFIRAPVIRRTGPLVEVLGSLPDGTPIAVKEGNLIGTSFHPELTLDTRFHAYFLALAKEHGRLSNAAAI